MYKVLIVDDQSTSQDFMKYVLLPAKDRYKVVDSLNDAGLAEAYAAANKLDLVLLDIYTNGSENGLKVAARLKKSYPKIKIIMITFAIEQSLISEARQAGCDGFWYKDHNEGDLLAMIDAVMAGQTCYPDKAPIIKIGQAKSSDFTPQELRVLRAKTNGYSNAEVCMQLNIKPPTLDSHIRKLKTKTGYDNMLQLVADVAAQRFIIVENRE